MPPKRRMVDLVRRKAPYRPAGEPSGVVWMGKRSHPDFILAVSNFLTISPSAYFLSPSIPPNKYNHLPLTTTILTYTENPSISPSISYQLLVTVLNRSEETSCLTSVKSVLSAPPATKT